MIRVDDIVRAHRLSGSLNRLLAPSAFIDDTTFLTKGGHLGTVYRLGGADPECLDPSQRDAIAHRCAAMLRLLDETCSVYAYALKRRIDPLEVGACRHPFVRDALHRRIAYLNHRRDGLYEIDLFLVLLQDGLHTHRMTPRDAQVFGRHPLQALRRLLSVQEAVHWLDQDLARARATFFQHVAAVEVQLAELSPARLSKVEAYRFLRRLVNYRPHVAGTPLVADVHLDYFMADSPVECHRDHLDVDGVTVKLLTMKEPPSATFANMLDDLYAVPCEALVCLEWQRIPADRMRRELRSRQRHFFQQRVSLVNYVSLEAKADDLLVDESAGATVRQLGEAMTQVEVSGHFFGECSVSLALYDEDPARVDQAVAMATRSFGAHDGVLVQETYNLLNAWVSLVPGNRAYNLRRLALLETHAADLSALFAPGRGTAQCPHLGREAVAIFETQRDTLYHLALHVHDVGHTVVLGATGAGKSFLMNFLLTHAQRYDPLTVVFDFGGSYRKLATLLGASYLEVGLNNGGFTINPFSLPPTPEHLHFLHGFVRVLLQGGEGYRLSDAEDRELYDALENTYVLDPEQRRLLTLAHLLPRSLERRLFKWVEGGRYAALFDHVHDTLTLQDIQVFDFQAMRAFPDLLEPLSYYILHRVLERIQDPALAGRLKVCACDEVWWFGRFPALCRFFEEGLKTFRRHNGLMLLATQTSKDFASADLLDTVIDSCPTRLLLPSPGFDRDRYATLFHLNDTALQLLADLQPRGQFLLTRPGETRVLNLRVDKESYFIYTNTPSDNERVQAAVRQYGVADAMKRLAASS